MSEIYDDFSGGFLNDDVKTPSGVVDDQSDDNGYYTSEDSLSGENNNDDDLNDDNSYDFIDDDYYYGENEDGTLREDEEDLESYDNVEGLEVLEEVNVKNKEKPLLTENYMKDSSDYSDKKEEKKEEKEEEYNITNADEVDQTYEIISEGRASYVEDGDLVYVGNNVPQDDRTYDSRINDITPDEEGAIGKSMDNDETINDYNEDNINFENPEEGDVNMKQINENNNYGYSKLKEIYNFAYFNEVSIDMVISDYNGNLFLLNYIMPIKDVMDIDHNEINQLYEDYIIRMSKKDLFYNLLYNLIYESGDKDYIYINKNSKKIDMKYNEIFNENLKTNIIRSFYNNWNGKVNENYIKLEKKMVMINEITKSFKKLSKDELLISSKVEKNIIIENYEIKSFKGSKYNFTKHPEIIFNFTKPNKYIPLIKYVDKDSKPMYKVYNNDHLEEQINYQYMIDNIKYYNQKNKIYFIFWSGDDNDKIKDSVADSFQVVSFKLKSNNIKFVKSIKYSNKLFEPKERIMEVFKDCNIVDKENKKIRGIFNIYCNKKIYDGALLDYFLNNKLASKFIYKKENPTPYAIKKDLRFIFRNPLSIARNDARSIARNDARSIIKSERMKTKEFNFTSDDIKFNIEIINNINFDNTKLYDLKTHTIKEVNLKNKKSIIRILIDAIDEKMLNEFNKIMNKIFLNYDNFEREILYQSFNTYENKDMKKVDKIGVKKLREIMPKTFLKNYSRSCAKSFQPSLLQNTDEVKEDKNGNLSVNINGKNYPVIEFEYENKKVYFWCENETNKFPGLQILSNSVYAPCCFVNNQNKVGTNYDNYKKGISAVDASKKGSTKVLATNKILEKNVTTELPKRISDLIHRIISDEYKILRKGINLTEYAIIEALKVALNHQSVDLENYYKNLTNVNQNYIKQENVFNSKKSIINYYKFLEDEFDVNIIFLNELPDSNNNFFYIPSTYYNYIFDYDPNRKTILLYRTKGSESDNLKDYHYELIVFEKNETQENFLEGETTIEFYNLLQESYDLYYTNIYNKKELVTSKLINVRIGKAIKMLEEYNINVKSQCLDFNGKVKYLNVIIDNKEVTIFTEKIPPINTNVVKNETFNYLTFEEFNNLISYEITAYSKIINNDDFIGIWITLKNKKYTPLNIMFLVQSKPLENIKIKEYILSLKYKNNELKLYNKNFTDSYIKIKSKLSKIINIFQWVYSIIFYNNELTPVEFIRKHCIIKNLDQENYLLENYGINIPFYKNEDYGDYDKVINYISKVTLNLINKNSNLIIYNEEFARKILHHLINFTPIDFYQLEIKENKRFIENFKKFNYNYVDENIVFLKNIMEYENWIFSNKNEKDYEEKLKLHSSLNDYDENYIYLNKNKNGNVFMITPNDKKTTLGKAIKLASIANQYKIFHINDTNKLKYNDEKDYVIYGYDNDFNLTPFNKIGDTDDYIRIYYDGKLSEYNKNLKRNYSSVVKLI